jgi:hypothetical protein
MTLVARSAVTAAPASAAPPWPVDQLLINGANVDFGNGVIAAGIPPTSGTLAWDVPGGSVTPHLDGRIYAVNSANRAVRMEIEYFDAGDNPVGTPMYSMIRTPPNNAQHSWSVNMAPYGASNVYIVHVYTQQETAPGSGVYARVNAGIHLEI